MTTPNKPDSTRFPRWPDLIACLTTFVRSNLPGLEQHYSWKIPQFESERRVDSPAEQNIILRRYLADEWSRADRARRQQIARWYVSVYGGIRRNSDATIASYVDQSSEELANGNLDGVASWSKVLAIRNPQHYAIYDARVAVALNALQQTTYGNIGVYFPLVPSRSPKMKTAGSLLKTFRRAESSVPRAESYRHYLSALDHVASRIGPLRHQAQGHPCELIEMTLFALAPALAEALRGQIEVTG